MQSSPPSSAPTVSRRAVAAGLAWSGPALAATAAAPAFAASLALDVEYAFSAAPPTSILVGSGVPCADPTTGEDGEVPSSLTLSNQDDTSTLGALGFAIVEQPRPRGEGQSPTTTATLAEPVQYVVAYPAGLVRGASEDGPVFTFSNGTGDNWSGPEVGSAELTNSNGVTGIYDVFTFTWLGGPSQSTVADPNTTGEPAQSWAGTALSGDWAVSSSYCAPGTVEFFSNYYAGGTAAQLGTTPESYGTYTTANGFTGDVLPLDPGTGGWFFTRAPRG